MIASHGWAIAAVVVYGGFMICLAWIGARRTKSFRDFTIAGAKYGGLIIGLSVMSSRLSGSAYMGVPALAYKFGWSGFWIWVGAILASGLSAILVAKKTRIFSEKLGSYTVPDLLGDRFQSHGVRGILAAILIISLVPVMMAQFKAAGILLEAVAGLPYWLGVVISCALVMLYLGTGGQHAQILTDAAQAILMVLICLLIVPRGLSLVGGVGQLNTALAAEDPVLLSAFNPSYFSMAVSIGTICFFILNLTVQAYTANRWFSLRNVSQIRVVLLSFLVTYAIATIMSMSGLIGRVLLGSSVQPDKVVIQLAQNILHPGIAAFILVGLTAAIMSTVDALLISVSHSVANDIYRKILVPFTGKNPESADVERTALILGRTAVVVFGVLAAYLAISNPPQFLSLVLYSGVAVYTSAAFVPYMAALYWKRGTGAGAVAGMIAGFITSIICLFPLGMTPFITTVVGILVSAVVMVAVSLYTEPPSRSFVDNLFDSASVGGKG